MLPELSAPGVRPPVKRAFRALRHLNFRLYLLGLFVSMIGTYMQIVAEGWLVYRLTNSAFTLGLVGFVAAIPLVPWTLVAGALADRMSRRTLLAMTQIGQVLPPLLLAALTWSGHVQVWHVIVTNVVMGMLSAVDQPTRQALVLQTTGPSDLDNAIALSASAFNVARVIGPAIAGVLVAFLGEAACFALNGVSFLAALVALLAMRLSERAPVTHQPSLGQSLIDGGRYLARERVILALIGLAAIVSLFVLPYQTLLPVFARDILGAGAVGLGLLGTAAGLGAVVGALSSTAIPPRARGSSALALGLIVSVVATGFALCGYFPLACLLLALVSAAVVAIKVLTFTLIQVRVRDELRGRVMSMTLLLVGSAPRVGGLAAGYLAARSSAPLALELGALACLVCVIGLSVLVPQLRQVA
jgi:predicted MFS family arabinose efflux permease